MYVVGPVVAYSGNKVATVDSLQNYELTFTMELADDWSITEWQSIITIGDSHGQRFPAVLFHPNGGLHVVQSRSYCDACCCQWGANQATGVIFEAGKTYETKVQVKSNQMTVYIDGIVVGKASGSATYAVTDAAVYVGDPWHPTAKVTLSHICFREVPGLPSPAPTLTRAPTVTPIPTADICGGPGTSTYDGRTLRCIQLSDGEAVDVLEVEGIVQTCRYRDDNSCPAGFDIWVPRSYEHAKAVVNAVDVEFTYLVGVYRNEDGPNGWPNEGNEEDCGGCTDVAMNSDNYADWVAQGTNRVPWTSVAGSPWFLRSTTYSEPNGNYESGCWLTTNWDDGWVDGEGFSFDDGGCGYCFTKYLCSTNRASTFSPTITPAPTATPAPTPDRCTPLYVAGPVVASHGNKVATIDSLQNYELTFTMELASDWSPGGGWHCILHIGNLDRQRLPGLWFHNSQNALHVRQSQSSEWSDYGPWETTGEAFAAGETYDIKVVVQNNQMTVYVDGVVVGTASGSATYTTSAAVYVGGQWHDAAAVTLSHICLKEIVYPSPAPVTPQSESCQRPSFGCYVSHDIYTNTDCDGDGILDHMCTTTINSNRWLVLSSEGCPQDWGTSSRAASECAPTTGTYIPGTYRLIGTSMGRSNYGVHYVTYTVTEDGKVEVIDVMHVNTHGWGGTAELSENDTGEYEDYPYKITGGSYKWELARFSPDPNNPSKTILDVRHYNPSFCCTGSGSSYVGGCALYIAGPVVASKGNQVATVDSLQNYELSFTMELASDWSVVGTWQSVIHIGNTDGERFPGIWFEPNLPRLKVYQHYSASWSDHYSAGDVAPASGAFEAGETYDIKVVVESNQMAVYVDGVKRGTASGSATWYAADMGVYVGSGVSWWPTAKVTLSDITLSDIALTDVCRANVVATTTTATVPCATPAVPVEGSLTFTVGGMTYAEGVNGHLYVKLWSGTTLIPLSGCGHMTVVEAFPEKITTTSMTGDRRFFNVDMSPRPTASGYIDETGSVHTGECTFPDDRTYIMYYHPDTHIIYWDVDEGTHTWTPSVMGQSTSYCDPSSSPTVSVPTYSGSCSTAYRDNEWSGPSGWLKLDDIDVSTLGATSSQSLGSLDPTLPLTHIELYYNENNGLGVQDVSIQVGDAYYGVPEDWTLVNGGNGWLETDQRCVWWMEIEIVRLDGPVGGLPCDGPRDDDSDEDDDEDSDVVALVASLCVVGAFLVVCGIIYAKKYYSSKNAKVAAVPNNAATNDGDTITVEAPPGRLGLEFDGTSAIVKEVLFDSPLVGTVYPGDVLKSVNGVTVTGGKCLIDAVAATPDGTNPRTLLFLRKQQPAPPMRLATIVRMGTVEAIHAADTSAVQATLVPHATVLSVQGP